MNIRKVKTTSAQEHQSKSGRGRCLDLDINPSRQRELIQSIYCFARWLNDVDQSLVGPDLKLLTRLLVDVRTPKNRIPLYSSRQRNRTMNNCPSALCSVHNIRCRLIQHGVVIRFHPNPDTLFTSTCHRKPPSANALRKTKSQPRKAGNRGF